MPDSITGGPRRDASAAYTEYVLCYPPHPVFTRLSELFMAAFARNGADPLTRCSSGCSIVGVRARGRLRIAACSAGSSAEVDTISWAGRKPWAEMAGAAPAPAR